MSFLFFVKWFLKIKGFLDPVFLTCSCILMQQSCKKYVN